MAEDTIGSTDTGATEGQTDSTDTTTGGTGDTDAGKDTTGQGDAGKPWAPPSESEWKAIQEKLKKANGQAAAHRKEADELKRKGETESEAAVRTAREEALAEAEKTWRPRIVRQAARAALVGAGLVGKPDRLLKLIDEGAVEIDEDGEVSGLDAQIRELRKDYPEMFAKRGSGSVDGADRGGNDSTRKGGMSATSRRLLDQVRG